ncbi:MAG: site-specific integrase [Planctomycetota bacterium]
METRKGAIDIHHHERKLEGELESFKNDTRILAENKETLVRYITDRRTGRRERRHRVEKASTGRCRKLLTVLRRFAVWLDVPFDEMTGDTIEAFILGIEDGIIGQLTRARRGQPYSPSTISDFKRLLRIFVKYLYPQDPQKVQDLVGWFDMKAAAPEPKALDPRLIPGLARSMNSIQGEAYVWCSFDAGTRVAETLNLRLCDVRFERHDERLICVIDVTVSKTFARTIAMPLAAEAMRFWIMRHPAVSGIAADGTIETSQPEATVFTWSYNSIRKRLRRAGEAELSHSVHPHMLRHTSATYWSTRLNSVMFRLRMGWSVTSEQPNRYVRRRGYLDDESARAVIGHDGHAVRTSDRDPIATGEQTEQPDGRSALLYHTQGGMR